MSRLPSLPPRIGEGQGGSGSTAATAAAAEGVGGEHSRHKPREMSEVFAGGSHTPPPGRRSAPTVPDVPDVPPSDEEAAVLAPAHLSEHWHPPSLPPPPSSAELAGSPQPSSSAVRRRTAHRMPTLPTVQELPTAGDLPGDGTRPAEAAPLEGDRRADDGHLPEHKRYWEEVHKHILSEKPKPLRDHTEHEFCVLFIFPLFIFVLFSLLMVGLMVRGVEDGPNSNADLEKEDARIEQAEQMEEREKDIFEYKGNTIVDVANLTNVDYYGSQFLANKQDARVSEQSVVTSYLVAMTFFLLVFALFNCLRTRYPTVYRPITTMKVSEDEYRLHHKRHMSFCVGRKQAHASKVVKKPGWFRVVM
jgi:hypothetical protein